MLEVSNSFAGFMTGKYFIFFLKLNTEKDYRWYTVCAGGLAEDAESVVFSHALFSAREVVMGRN